ncbi:MAG: TylF/MycF/NovP-related O-methyltransferase [Nocardioides sp.]
MWKQKVNGAMRRVTGYELQRPSTPDGSRRGGGGPRADQLRERLERTEAKLVEARTSLKQSREQLREAEKTARRARKRAERATALPDSYGEATSAIIRRVGDRTMTDHRKLFGLIEATRYLARNSIPGDVVECGVWRGGSMQAVALTLIEQGDTGRNLHLFDTFEGMPPPTDDDRRGDVTAEELLARHDKDHRVWAIAGLDDVREAMSEVAYPEDGVHFHVGMVEDTIPDQAPEQIALLRLDTDWYESTRHELEHLYRRLSPGGVLILDDYGDWEGARKAADEFIAGLGTPLLLAPLGSGRIAVKPGP